MVDLERLDAHIRDGFPYYEDVHVGLIEAFNELRRLREYEDAVNEIASMLPGEDELDEIIDLINDDADKSLILQAVECKAMELMHLGEAIRDLLPKQ